MNLEQMAAEDRFTREVAKASWEAAHTTGRSWEEIEQERNPFRYGQEMRRARAAIATVLAEAAPLLWQAGHDTPREYIVESTLSGQDHHVILGPSASNPYKKETHQ